MQIFQETQKNFGYFGLSSEVEPLNQRSLSIIVMASMSILTEWIFLIHDGHSSQEYMESIYVVSTNCGVFVSFASTILIREKLFAFIKNVDEFIEECE